MEIYILLALVFIYVITALAENSLLTRRIWILAFIISFMLMGASLSAIHLDNEDIMLSAGQFNWYYFLYLFSTLSFTVGVINMWIYRRELLQLCRKESDDNKE